MFDQLTGSRLAVTTAGTQPSPQTSLSDCVCLASSSASVTAISESSVISATTSSPDPAHSGSSSKNVLPPLYPVYHPYIFMGFSVQPLAYPQHQSDPPGSVTGSRKHTGSTPGSKQLPPSLRAKRRHRKQRQQRKQHGADVVSSTTPDSSLLETTSGPRASPFPVEMTSAEKAEEMSPLCLTVSRDKPVYDSCGALDLSVRK